VFSISTTSSFLVLSSASLSADFEDSLTGDPANKNFLYEDQTFEDSGSPKLSLSSPFT